MKVCGIVVYAVAGFFGLVVLQPLGHPSEVNIGAAVGTWLAGFIGGSLYYAFGIVLEKLAIMERNQEQLDKNQRIIGENQILIANNQVEDEQWQAKVDNALQSIQAKLDV